MIFKLLGSSAAELTGYNSPAFLIDGCVLLDVSTFGSYIVEKEQLNYDAISEVLNFKNKVKKRKSSNEE